MKKSLFKGYSILIIILTSITSISLFYSMTNLDDFYSNTINSIDEIKGIYMGINQIEERYINTSDKDQYIYIGDKYFDLKNKIDDLGKKLSNRELQFLLNEIDESIGKHKESFFRSLVYLEDTKKGKEWELFYVENFNLEKSKELFKIQNIIFDKKIQKFITQLKEFHKEEKLRKEKISFTVFSISLLVFTISLKYIYIWGENNGYFNGNEKSKGKKVKNFFY